MLTKVGVICVKSMPHWVPHEDSHKSAHGKARHVHEIVLGRFHMFLLSHVLFLAQIT